MAIDVICSKCGHVLKKPGAVVLAPPEGSVVVKHHICAGCWSDYREELDPMDCGKTQKGHRYYNIIELRTQKVIGQCMDVAIADEVAEERGAVRFEEISEKAYLAKTR